MIDSPGCDNFPHPHASTGCSICEPWALASWATLHPLTKDTPGAYFDLMLAHALDVNPTAPEYYLNGICVPNPRLTKGLGKI